MRCFQSDIFYFAPLEQWLIDFVARYLVILNSPINFIIYYLVGSQFRKDLSQMIGLDSASVVLAVNEL